jgi:hypothetical protein
MIDGRLPRSKLLRWHGMIQDHDFSSQKQTTPSLTNVQMVKHDAVRVCDPVEF